MTYLDMPWVGNILTNIQLLAKSTHAAAGTVELAERQETAADRPDYAAADETGAVPLSRN